MRGAVLGSSSRWRKKHLVAQSHVQNLSLHVKYSNQFPWKPWPCNTRALFPGWIALPEKAGGMSSLHCKVLSSDGKATTTAPPPLKSVSRIYEMRADGRPDTHQLLAQLYTHTSLASTWGFLFQGFQVHFVGESQNNLFPSFFA